VRSSKTPWRCVCLVPTVDYGPLSVSEPTSQESENLAREILAYFLRNPQCADDLHGITRWRLLDQMIHQALYDTRAALDLLVQEGYLRKESITGADPIFRLNADRETDALSFVNEKEDEVEAGAEHKEGE
jgi:hypothetical protein